MYATTRLKNANIAHVNFAAENPNSIIKEVVYASHSIIKMPSRAALNDNNAQQRRNRMVYLLYEWYRIYQAVKLQVQ
ncbi:MAG: hypothetical protein FWF15_03945 [Oscillospiraceae bacterium]|nr:hypothetical protein [Oscillospiraceae bacterium]